MATSTALRFRNRSQPNPVVVSDTLAGLQSNAFRVLSDSLSVVDAEMIKSLSVKNYFRYVLATLSGKGQGDRVVQ